MPSIFHRKLQTTAGLVCGLFSLLSAVCFTSFAQAQVGTVDSHQKISDTEGGFTGTLDDLDVFGNSVTSPGDLDGDNIPDLVVGAPFDDDGGTDRGAVWVLFMNADGTVASHQKISDTEGFTGTLDDSDFFGSAVASPGDLDGDNIPDLVVGAPRDDDGGTDRGAVWVLFMNADGTVASHQKISDTEGSFNGTLDNLDFFGSSVTSAGDLDGDNIPDLVVGAPFDDDGGTARGAVWVLFMNADGTVASHQKISDTEGGFTGTLDDFDVFGSAVASPSDLDGDNIPDLVAGAPEDDDGGSNRGAIWILFMNANGTVASHQKISDTEGGFTGTLNNFDHFGSAVASPGDLDGDTIRDLVAGAPSDNDGGGDRGAIWVLFMNADGTVASHQKISDTEGGFTGTLNNDDSFGAAVASPGDLDGDNIPDLVVGAPDDDDGGSDRGAVWILFLNGVQIEIAIDIKFCSNPNAFNCKKRGVLPVTIFGSDDLDVNDIDISTVQLCLASNPSTCISIIDAGFPVDRGDPDRDLGTDQCATVGEVKQANPDGFDDIEALFSATEVATLIGCPKSKGSTSPSLIIKGELIDGVEFISNPVDDVGIDQLLIVTR